MNSNEIFMAFPQPLHGAIFLKREQRFLASMKLADGSHELVYCANSGAMVGDLSPGSRALIWDSGDAARKMRFTWRAIEAEGLWIGTDTHLSNRIVEEALRLGLIPRLQEYDAVCREHVVEPGFRVDFVLSGPSGQCLLEVKSANIVENGMARYPDSPTPRGVKQLKILAQKASEGIRSVVLFLVQRADAHSFSVSEIRDTEYLTAFKDAEASGVEILAMSVSVNPQGFGVPKLLRNSMVSSQKIGSPAEGIIADSHQSPPRNGIKWYG